MTDPTGISRRTSTLVPGTSAEHYAPVQTQSAGARQTLDLQQLRSLRIPSTDHSDFAFPALCADEKNARMAELDSRVEFFRSTYGPGADDEAMEAHYEHHVESLKVTREAVLAFMNDGICPNEDRELQALVIFLVKNKLPDALSWLLVQTGTETLDMNNCDLGNEEVGMIADWAKTIPFQIRLDLQANRINADGAALLASALPANTITHLNLGNNPLKDKGVQALGAALSRNVSLKSLVLYHAGMENPGIEALAGVLDSHPALAVLVVDGNGFDDQGAATLAAALGKNKTLSRLSVRFSQLSDIGLAYLAGALTSNTSLKTLQLSSVRSQQLSGTDEEWVHLPYALADALAVNQTLTRLVVFAGSMPGAAINRLAAAVAVNTTLREFDLALAPYNLSQENAAVASQISEKVQANALIADAGLALSELSQLPEWGVPIPPEVGQQIAAYAAQVAENERRSAAMNSMIEAGPMGATRLESDVESKTDRS